MQNRVLYPLGIALPLTVAVITGFPNHNSVFAQLTPDNTLGLESSIVTPQQLRDLIQGGAIRGNALFHSFQDFNVGDGRSVFFDLQNNTDILNIFTRVTGGNVSNILGTLGVLQDALNSNVLGNANLFLLNPNGITFGGNANLQLNGSFFATTADGFGFDDFTFSASGEEAPPPLLTISIPRFASFRDNPGNIQIDKGILTVNEGQGLSFLGGNINISGGTLSAPGISIDLGGLTAAGTVNLNPDFSFVLPDGVARGDVSLTDGASINTSTVGVNDAGDINIQANSVNLDESNIFTQVEANSVASGGDININTDFLTLINGAQINASILGEGNAGNITINATDTISIDGVGSTNSSSAIVATVQTGAVGDAGNIDITTNSLSLTNGGFIGSSIFAQGNGGVITINAETITADGAGTNGVSSGIQAFVAPGAQGVGGSVNITTDLLSLTNGGFIGGSTFGLGDAGDININAINIALDGIDPTGFFSGIQSAVVSGGEGNGGNLNINTEFLSLTDGAQISAGNFGFGIGNAGNITINATDTITIDGIGTNNFSSVILASVQGIGDAGDINISTSLLSLTDGGNIQATVGAGAQGFGGSINIATESLNLTNGAQINASTLGEGNTGNINISATDAISIDGVGSTGFSSSITANVVGGAVGESEDINIATGYLSLTNGGFIGISTFAQGNGGSIVIDADTITADGVGTNGVSSGIQASVAASAEGNVGDIFIGSNFLELTNGAQISTATFGIGNAGDIKIDVTDTVNLDGSGSGIFSNVSEGAIGNGGSINIDPEQVNIFNDATISVSNQGIGGDAGRVFIVSDNLTLLNNGLISAQDNFGAGGFIDLQIEDFLILNNSTISAAGTQAGRLDLQSTALVMFNNSLITVDSDNLEPFANFSVEAVLVSPNSTISVGGDNINFNTQVSVTPTAEVETIEPDQQITQSVCSDFGGDSQLSNTGRGGIPQIPGLIPRNSVINVDLVDEVLPPPPPEAIKPHHRTDVTFLDSNGEEFKPAMGAVLLPNGMVEFVDYNPAEVYRDMYAAAGCSR